jgi:hypothetical protein
MQEEVLARGRELAGRVHDQNLLIDAVQDKFDEWEVFVPMWMNAATSQTVIGKLEKETELSTRKSSAGHTCCEIEKNSKQR